MKLHVVFEENGRILGAVQLDGPRAVVARPMADEQAGHRFAEVYVPAEYRHYDLAAVCQRMTVDVKGEFPALRTKG